MYSCSRGFVGHKWDSWSGIALQRCTKLRWGCQDVWCRLSLRRRCNLGLGSDLPQRAIQLWTVSRQYVVSAAEEWRVCNSVELLSSLLDVFTFMKIRHLELQNLEFQELEGIISKEETRTLKNHGLFYIYVLGSRY